ncbi:MAG: MBL fold metallo-hydrolase [Coriobacteriales bacterium]|jgi:glyoxylase-like metal-dependent hydrolase (beta-lactamase superfamily II)|nr:MBL fold metallo-hydrolase [Coriobacteriales bacterium]
MAKINVSDEYREFSTHGEIRVNRHGKGKLATKVFVANDDGFAVTNVIIMGKEKCAVFDTQWTKANALRCAAEIVEENLELETIYMSHAHPDHYFGAEVLKQVFPNARVIAVPEEAAIIQKQWSEKRNEVVPDIGEINYAAEQIPFTVEPLHEDHFLLEGERIEIIPRLMGDYRYNTAGYIPSIDTLMCSDILFNEAHPFTCEVNKEERAEWIDVCKKLKAMNASVVIPGHLRMGMPFNNDAFDWTIDYIEKTEIELERAKSPGDFFFAMDRHFPNAILKKSNEMNAMVFFGGREWDWREEEVWEQGAS